MHGKTVCITHGGRTPQGIALPQTKTGRYSKHLPTRMLAMYEEAKADPELLALTDEIGVIDARMVDLLKRVDTGESGATWAALRKTYRAYQDALAKPDIGEMKVQLSHMGDLITEGIAEEAAWQDIRSCLEQRRRLVESERKRLVEMQQLVSADQAMLMVRSLVASVREHVHDPAILRRITDDLSRLAVARTD